MGVRLGFRALVSGLGHFVACGVCGACTVGFGVKGLEGFFGSDSLGLLLCVSGIGSGLGFRVRLRRPVRDWDSRSPPLTADFRFIHRRRAVRTLLDPRASCHRRFQFPPPLSFSPKAQIRT